MAKWEQLIAARESKHLSQSETAERVNVGLVTYQRWEAGKAKPQPQHMRQLYEVFGTMLDHLDVILAHEVLSHENVSDTSPASLVIGNPSEETLIVVPVEEIGEPQAFIAANMTTRLWFLAFMDHPTCNDKHGSIRQAIKEFDTMNTNNKNYQMTRREALCSLATLPMITLGLTVPGRTVPSTQYGNVLAHCTASLEACWELSKSSNASDLTLAFKSVSKYLSVLKSIVNNSSQYRKEAADLTARYGLLKTVLGWHCKGLADAIQYAKDAVVYSKETEDTSLQLSAYSKLSWAFLYDKKYILALKTAQEARFLLEQEQNRLSIPPCIRGGTYSTIALMQAKNGITPDSALGKATEIDPGDECYAFMEFTRSDLPRETGLIYCYQGNQEKAMEALEKIIDPATLSTKTKSERGRIDVINIMALSSLKAKDRDMEKTVHFWKATIEGVKALQSEWGFNEAVTTYELMEVAWPGEGYPCKTRYDHNPM
jgi:transcriptional regulator with XRE-family HTH domain/tetratricopeptide (TPR) repeat protein